VGPGSQFWSNLLEERAPAYAQVALDNIGREYPNDSRYLMRSAEDAVLLTPRQRHPVFYGSFDWHSCVEMHWVLARLGRLELPGVDTGEIRRIFDAQLREPALEREASHLAHPDHRNGQRPYGWGWSLALVEEVAAWRNPAATGWAANLAGFGDVVTDLFLDWLPRATYPVRYGMHSNSAFGLSLALPHARRRAQAGDGRLAEAIETTALGWFGNDRDYPGAFEPSGIDFLSAALVEAELVGQLLAPSAFAGWLDRFLPGILAREPATLFTPAYVSDSSDGHIAHLHGLNASRAWCWRRLAGMLPPGDPRVPVADDAAVRHAEAALPHVVGDDYMVEHWLVCYAVLLLSCTP
jgi:type II secretory pathway component PulJ